jgi:hypothetical protein
MVIMSSKSELELFRVETGAGEAADHYASAAHAHPRTLCGVTPVDSDLFHFATERIHCTGTLRVSMNAWRDGQEESARRFVTVVALSRVVDTPGQRENAGHTGRKFCRLRRVRRSVG